ncbi:MAG: hypothetical protein SWK76_03450, partial [Actinomycetota bacterium]|nr:hypothetical protein [Actinomycetota bacterium]
ISIPRMREMLPMLLVGWGAYLGAISRFEYLLVEKPIEAIPRALTNFVGVILSVIIGLLLAVLLHFLVLSPRQQKVAAETPAPPEITES